MLIDILLILLGLVLVLVGTIQRFVRALMILLSVYIATVSGLVLYWVLSPWVGEVVGKKQNLRDGVSFLLVFYLVFFIFFLLLYKSFPDTRLMKLKAFDFVLGFIVSVFAVAALSGVTLNAVGVMIGDSWNPSGIYQLLFNAYTTSNLRILVTPLMDLYVYLFYPLYQGYYPNFLVLP